MLTLPPCEILTPQDSVTFELLIFCTQHECWLSTQATILKAAHLKMQTKGLTVPSRPRVTQPLEFWPSSSACSALATDVLAFEHTSIFHHSVAFLTHLPRHCKLL